MKNMKRWTLKKSGMWNRTVICLLPLLGMAPALSLEALNGSEILESGDLLDSGVLIIDNAIEPDLVERLSSALADCSLQEVDADMFVSPNLDGSLRATFASKANERFEQCSRETQELVMKYKSRTEKIGLKVAEFLDEQHFVEGPKIQPLITSSDSASLDHFHIYREKSSNDRHSGDSNSPQHSIPFHVDMGLFLLLTPGQWVGENLDKTSHRDSDLVVKRKNGSTFDITPANPGSVILLFGAGLTNWLYRGTSGLRAAVHAVNPISTINGGSRVVLGRMFLPPMDSISESGIRFEDFFMSSSKIIKQAPVDQSSFQWRRLMESRCSAGEKYCWMDCMPDVDCGEGIESMCMNHVTGKVCLETDCDTDCTVMCPPRPPTLSPSPVASSPENGSNMTVVTRASQQSVPVVVTVTDDEIPFCRGGTSMVMSGFESVGSSNANCIILFFRPWLLNSPWKFGLGCLGVFLLGLLVEAAIKLRRFATNKMKVHSRFWREFVVISLFAVNVALGYLCMLAAMTFNVEIFISTVMGLALGHLLLGNSAEPVRETADPCCVTSEATNTAAVTTTLVNSTGACCCDTRPR